MNDKNPNRSKRQFLETFLWGDKESIVQYREEYKVNKFFSYLSSKEVAFLTFHMDKESLSNMVIKYNKDEIVGAVEIVKNALYNCTDPKYLEELRIGKFFDEIGNEEF